MPGLRSPQKAALAVSYSPDVDGDGATSECLPPPQPQQCGAQSPEEQWLSQPHLVSGAFFALCVRSWEAGVGSGASCFLAAWGLPAAGWPGWGGAFRTAWGSRHKAPLSGRHPDFSPHHSTNEGVGGAGRSCGLTCGSFHGVHARSCCQVRTPDPAKDVPLWGTKPACLPAWPWSCTAAAMDCGAPESTPLAHLRAALKPLLDGEGLGSCVWGCPCASQ